MVKLSRIIILYFILYVFLKTWNFLTFIFWIHKMLVFKIFCGLYYFKLGLGGLEYFAYNIKYIL